MDSDLNPEWFCGHVCLAASRLGIIMREEPGRFILADSLTRQIFGVSEYGGDRRAGLMKACDLIVEFLKVPECQTQPKVYHTTEGTA